MDEEVVLDWSASPYECEGCKEDIDHPIQVKVTAGYPYDSVDVRCPLCKHEQLEFC